MRLFLAVELEAAVRARLAAIARRLEACVPGWRWMRAEGIHLTLRFLGEVSAERDTELREGWRSVAAAVGPFGMELGSVGCFPRGGAPRVLWVEALETGGGDSLSALATDLEQVARRAGFEAEHRPFRPHLTLARARRGARPVRPVRVDFDRGGPMQVEALTLFRSELQPSGARYTALETFALEGLAEGPP